MICDKPYTKVLKEPIDLSTASEKHLQWTIDLPCGKCLNCIKTTRLQWVFRLYQELALSKHPEGAAFCTFTYSDATIPTTEEGESTLYYEDMQRFYRKLRYQTKKIYPLEEYEPIKYFTVGEYGGQTGRAHWHAIIFNSPTKLIKDIWESQFGYADVKPANLARLMYTLKYIDKLERYFHEDQNKEYEFRVMSQNLGERWLTESRVKEIKKGELDQVRLPDGKQVAIPRYYIKKALTDEERITRAKRINRKVEEARIECERQQISLKKRTREELAIFEANRKTARELYLRKQAKVKRGL